MHFNDLPPVWLQSYLAVWMLRSNIRFSEVGIIFRPGVDDTMTVGIQNLMCVLGPLVIWTISRLVPGQMALNI